MILIGIVLLVAAVYAVSVAAGFTGTGPKGVRKRLQELAPAAPEAADTEGKVKIETHRPGLAGALTPPFMIRKIERNLLLSGHPQGWSVERALLAKPVALAIGVLMAVAVISSGVPFVVRVLVVCLVVIFYFAPDLLIYNSALKRQQLIEKGLPDTLDQITISIEAGLGFEAALDKVGQTGKGPVAEEFIRVIQDMNLGMSRRDAYESLAQRTSVDDLRRFSKSIIQAEEQGVPIASVVRMQAKEMRMRRRSRAEAKAQQVPVKILFPLMTLILPVLFIIVMGPPVANAFRIN